MLTLVAACGGGHIAEPPASLGAAVDFTIPDSIANLPLTKSDGSTTTLAAYRGKAVMIADSLTLCTDICPMVSANVAALARALDQSGVTKDVALLEITVDPKRDTPARLAAYATLFPDVPASWTLLTASPADIAAIWKYFGVQYAKEKAEPSKHPTLDWFTHKPITYDVSHADDLIFIDANGHERFVVNAQPNAAKASVPVSLVKALTKQGRRNLDHPNPVTTWAVPQGLSVFSWLLDKKLATTD
jgi:protein SCO1/2